MNPPVASSIAPESSRSSNVRWSGLTHVGRVRKNNEDTFLALTFDGHDVRYLGKTGDAPLAGADFIFAVSDGLCLSDDVITHIHHSFIEELVETGNVGYVAASKCRGRGRGWGRGITFGHTNRIRVHYIFHCLCWFDRSNICVRFLENVLAIGHLLIFLEVFGSVAASTTTASSSSSSSSSRFRSNFGWHFETSDGYCILQ